MTEKRASTLVSTEWLADNLDNDRVRIFDCTVYLGFDPETGEPWRSGLKEYEAAHIPGAAFVDLTKDFTVHTDAAVFMMPSVSDFCEAASKVGIGKDYQVILYSTGSVMWATRLWWTLRSVGFTNVAVLDGGLQKWQAENRPTNSGHERYSATTLTASPKPELWTDKDTVLARIGESSTCTINTLSPKRFEGLEELSDFEKMAYGRPGRITGSVNVYYGSLLQEDGTFAPDQQLRQMFASVNALEKDRIICYCGGGISSTMGALALHMLGYDNVTIYDGSLNEWGRNLSLPMETG